MEWFLNTPLLFVGVWILLGLMALALIYLTKLTKDKEEKISFWAHFGIIGLGFFSLFGAIDDMKEHWFVS